MLRYLRYDLRAPAFLAAPLYFIAPERNLKNPFYYRRDPEAEMSEIYSLQFDEIAFHTPQVIVFSMDSRIVRLAAALHRRNIACFSVEDLWGFPFQAIGHHMGPGGNHYFARLIFSSLTGANDSRQAVLEFTSLSPPFAVKGQDHEPAMRRLSSYRDVHVEVAGRPLGRFFNPTVDWKQYCVGPSCRFKPDVFKNAESIVGLGAAGESPFDRPFLALGFPIYEGMQVVERAYLRGRLMQARESGRINLLRAGFPVGWAEAGLMEKWMHNTNETSLDVDIAGAFDAVELCVGGKVVLGGKRLGKSGIVRMLPSSGSALLFIKADGRVPFNPDAAPLSGNASLCLQDAARKMCAPIAAFKKRERTFPVAGVSKPLTVFGSSR